MQSRRSQSATDSTYSLTCCASGGVRRRRSFRSAGSTIHHTNDVTLSEADGDTTVKLHVSITRIGPRAKMAAFGMKWGYKAQFDKLAKHLAAQP